MATSAPVRPVSGRHARGSMAFAAVEISGGAAYRPALDGVRTLAVYLVLAFHAGWSVFGNGYVGVDLFFVLSGFLITGLLLREYRRTGQVKLARFYARRIRRLLPASLVVLTIGLVATLVVAGPLYQDTIVDDARASMLWVANWHFIAVGNDYFSADDTSPFIHFWSLAVEEQYYLIWPAIILGTFTFALRNRLRREGLLVLVCSGLLVISVVLAFVIAGSDPLRSYYGTETRAYQLLAGALLALLINVHSQRYKPAMWVRAQWVAVALVVLLALGSVSMNLTLRGVIITAAAVLLIASLELVPSGPVAALLSRPTMAALGRISYGTYLWHMPVLFILVETINPGPIVLAVVTAGVATGLAAISAQFIETPIRRSQFLEDRPRGVIVVGLGVSVILAFTLLPRLGDVADATRLDARSAPTSPGDASPRIEDIDWIATRNDFGSAPRCQDGSAADCIVVDNGPDAVKVNVVGDSHARSILPALSEIARDEGWTLSATVAGGCPWQWGILYPRQVGENADKCADFQNNWYERLIPELKPDVTIMVSVAFTDPSARMKVRAAKDEQSDWTTSALVEASSERAVRAVRDTGSEVIFIEPTPLTKRSSSPLECLSEGGSVGECSFKSEPKNQLVLKAQERMVEQFDNVWQANLNRTVCPELPLCEPFIDGSVVRIDGNHIAASYWIKQKDEILKALISASKDSSISAV